MRNVTAARNKPLMASSHSSRRKQQHKTKPINPFLRFSVILLTFLSLLSIALYSNRTRTRNERKAVAYSLWLEPPTEDDLSSRVENFIVENAKNDVAFKPHVTLLGPIYDDDERAMVAKTENLVREIREKMMKKTTKTFNIRFPKGAQIGQTYFQCVYLEAELTSNLLRAREKAIELFDIRDARRYTPHMSLAYGDDSQGERLRLKLKADEVFKKAFSLSNTDEENEDETYEESFNATSVSLWKTDVEDKSCKSWRKVKEFPLFP